jgi:threonine/homoserine/homoserine lactone efflux protein
MSAGGLARATDTPRRLPRAVTVRCVQQLLALVGFSFITSVTPGPNNLLLWASGTAFGYRRTVRHVIGTSLGIGAMALGVAAGIGALVAAVPEIALIMKAVGSIYLLFLAWQIAGAHALARGFLAKPLGVRQAAAFQVINPKAWVFVLGAITTFRPVDLPVVVGSLAATATMMVVVLPAASIWAAGGGVLGRLLAGERTARATSVVLGVLLVATVAYVWV